MHSLQRFLFAGYELTDETKTLAELKIIKESTIQVFCSPLEEADGAPMYDINIIF
jgi:hypothetical protein